MILFFDHRPVDGIKRIRGKYLNIHKEYDNLGMCALCISQNRLQRCEECFNLFGGYAESTQANVENKAKNLASIKRHKIKPILANFRPKRYC
jgi:hypothetical protein